MRKPLRDEPLLLSEIRFSKHYLIKPMERELSSIVVDHNPFSEFAQNKRNDEAV